MLIQAYGRFWERDLVDWGAHGWQLLGRQGIQRGTLTIANFRRARGVYMLYNDVGPYYVGLSEGANGIGGRLYDHLGDDHAGLWTRFSWFSFDAASGDPDRRGVRTVEQAGDITGSSNLAIYEMEAILQRAIVPSGNLRETQFAAGKVEWLQVATKALEVHTFDTLQQRLK